MDIEETAEDNKNKNNSTKNYDVATIDNAVEKNFEIEKDADSLEEIAKIETTENPTETTTEEDSEEKEDKDKVAFFEAQIEVHLGGQKGIPSWLSILVA